MDWPQVSAEVPCAVSHPPTPSPVTSPRPALTGPHECVKTSYPWLRQTATAPACLSPSVPPQGWLMEFALWTVCSPFLPHLAPLCPHKHKSAVCADRTACRRAAWPALHQGHFQGTRGRQLGGQRRGSDSKDSGVTVSGTWRGPRGQWLWVVTGRGSQTGRNLLFEKCRKQAGRKITARSLSVRPGRLARAAGARRSASLSREIFVPVVKVTYGARQQGSGPGRGPTPTPLLHPSLNSGFLLLQSLAYMMEAKARGGGVWQHS